MNTIISKTKTALGLAIAITLATTLTHTAHASVIKPSPIITKLQKQKQPLAKETDKWMKKWVGTDIEAPGFIFNELSGTTSINLKVRKLDPTDPNGYKAYGTFVTRGGSANFDIEIAYYNLASILGYSDIVRPAVPYALGKTGSKAFTFLLKKELAITDPTDRRTVRINRILDRIATTPTLLGCLKAKKQDSYAEYKFIADRASRSQGNTLPPIPLGNPLKTNPQGDPLKTNPIIMALQASNPLPLAGQKIQLQPGYTGDALQLAHEFSVVMTLDAIFQQWDRYNNTNVGLAKDKNDTAHFYITDSGGADMSDYLPTVLRNLNYFSRYDRKTIQKLKQLQLFLANPARGFMGYKNAETFVVDLGLYSEFTPTEYVRLLQRNLKLLLTYVARNERQYGAQAYLPEY